MVVDVVFLKAAIFTNMARKSSHSPPHIASQNTNLKYLPSPLVLGLLECHLLSIKNGFPSRYRKSLTVPVWSNISACPASN
jgi:hypothetical protein